MSTHLLATSLVVITDQRAAVCAVASIANIFQGFDSGIYSIIISDSYFIDYFNVRGARSGIVASMGKQINPVLKKPGPPPLTSDDLKSTSEMSSVIYSFRGGSYGISAAASPSPSAPSSCWLESPCKPAQPISP